MQPGQTISRAEAETRLSTEVAACAAHLALTIPHWQEMEDCQRCALIDFAWNLGEDFYGDRADFATISRDLRERRWEAVPDDFPLYRNPGSSVESGLRRRRQAEADLWHQGGPGTTPPPTLKPASGSPAASPRAFPNPLVVPWFDQLKMGDGQGWRDCFSASSALLAS